MSPFERASAWCARATQAGWLDEHARSNLDRLERTGAADLFEGSARPLVVALFGGTGVGKSSLLNRFAGRTVAPVGARRPTSQEPLLYLHAGVSLTPFPESLSTSGVRIERHDDPRWREVVWLDAPDIDSVSRHHREATLAWLPHVDGIVYVVSPERYRDDAGWRALLERAGRHGWLFVVNRWDQGHASQVEDFTGLLEGAGFARPLVFHTSCARSGTSPDDRGEDQFEQLEAAVRALLDERAVDELERLGRNRRLRALEAALTALLERFGDAPGWKALEQGWAEYWRRAREQLLEGMSWPLRAVAAGFAEGAPAVGREPSGAALEGPLRLWDDWAADRLEASIDQLELLARRSGVSASPLRAAMEEPARGAGDLLERCAGTRLRQALARPGGMLGRAARRGARFLTLALPAAALSWVGATVVSRYYRAGIGQGDYLDISFAVHSALLVLVAWALPFVLGRLLRPAMERVAEKALRAGLGEALAELSVAFERAFEEAVGEAARMRQEGISIVEEIEQRCREASPAGARPETLGRALACERREAD